MTKPIITFKNTQFHIGAKKIIQDFSTHIYPGDFIVLLGGNGSGKSTLLKLLNRTYHHTKGDILLHDKSISDFPESYFKKKLITLTQFTTDSLFSDLTLEENALLIEKSLHTDRSSIKDFLHALPHYLSEFHPTLKKSLKTRIKNLSGGEQQIAAFALYLRHQPDILLLDEHTSALDPKKADYVMAFTQKIITEKKITCLMTTHALPYALHYGNRIIAIREGNLIFDTHSEEKKTLTLENLLHYCY